MALKTVTPQATATTFFLPARDLLSIWPAVSTEKTRYYLNGALVEQCPDGLRMVATDGHILLRKGLPDAAFVGPDVFTQGDADSRGFILSVDTKDKAFKARTRGDAWIYGDVDTGIAQILDVTAEGGPEYARVGVLEFERIDGAFPDHSRVMPDCTPGEASAPVCVNPAKIAQMEAAGKVASGAKDTALRITAGEAGAPMLVEFPPSCGGLVGVIMPLRWGKVD